MKQIIILIITMVMINLAYADPTSTIIDSKELNVDGFTAKLSTSLDVQWEKAGNEYTPVFKDDSMYQITLDPKTSKVISKELKPLPEVSFEVNKLSEEYCTNGFYFKECFKTEWDFCKFEAKNRIDSKEIKDIYELGDLSFWTEFLKLFGYKPDVKVIGYNITYKGDIVDLDPSLIYVYTSSSQVVFLNQTEVSNFGLRLHAPVLFMDFNTPNEGTYVQDNSIYNNFGTNSGATYNAIGGYDESGAYQFDGVNDNITVADSTSLRPVSYTYSTWLKTSSTATMAVIDKYSGSSVAGNDLSRRGTGIAIVSGKARLNSRNSLASMYLDSLNVVNDNYWHHIVGTFDLSSTTSKIYVDGILQATNDTYAYEPSTEPFMIGARYDTGIRFNGAIDQVQIWNRALSADEVLQLYNGTKNNAQYIGKYNLQGDYKSGVFYNSTSTYWNVTLSTADTYSPATGIVNNKNEINLSNPNLVGYWALDNNYNDALGRNNGTCSGTSCPNNATGLSSGAYTFDGTNDFINLTNDVATLNALTISTWYKRAPVAFFIGEGDSIIDMEYGNASDRVILLFINNGTANSIRLRLGYKDAIATSDSAELSNIIMDYKWHHILVTKETNGNATYYVDSISKGIKNCSSGDVSVGNLNSIIGARGDVSTHFINGSIDEVLIYNTSLTPAEITQIYKSGLSQHANTNITLQTRTANNYNISDSGLVAFWALNRDTGENSTYFKDMLGVNNGTCTGTGCPTYTADGVVGGAYDFDGVNDRISIPPFKYGNTFTTSYWIKPSDLSGTEMILTKKTTPAIESVQQYISNQVIKARVFSADDVYIGRTTGNVLTTDWQFITITYNGSSASNGIKIYRNGIQVDNFDFQAGSFSSFNDLLIATEIGRQNALENPSAYFNGFIDEVRIYNRSLSASEIQNLYQLGSYHINWSSNWSIPTTVQDNFPSGTMSLGKFMQFKTTFNTNDTAVSPYLINHSISNGSAHDTTPPYFVILPNNSTYNYSTNISIQSLGNDTESNPVNYSINTTQFEINESGWIINSSGSVPVGFYSINETITDIVGNQNSTIFSITIQKYPIRAILYLNSTQADINCTNYCWVNITATTESMHQQNIYLERNNYPFIYGALPLTVQMPFQKSGNYTIKAYVLEDDTYQYSQENWTVRVAFNNSELNNPAKVYAKKTDNTIIGWIGKDSCIYTSNDRVGNCTGTEI